MQYGARPLRSTRRVDNKIGDRPRWYNIANAASDGLPTQVAIYDEIGFYGVAAGEFMADLKGVNGDIELHLNSPGGDVHDGLAIYNQLKQRSGTVAVIVDGLAASAASFIAQAASPGKLQMAPHSQMMIHPGFSMAIGNADDMRQTADLLDMITGEIAGIYSDRSGKPADYWLAQMTANNGSGTWYTDKQAVADGLADSILGDEPAAPSASWDLSVYGKAPAAAGPAGADVTNAGTDTTADTEPPEEPTPIGEDGWVQDPDGTVRFDPDGDGDDDSTPEGDTDHDYFDESGKQIKDIPPRPEPDPGEGGSIGNAADDDKAKKPFPGAAEPFKKKTAADLAALFPVLNADVDGSEWDAAKAWAAGAASDDPAKFYAGICAGRKAGDASNQDAWALPYKYSPSSPPNAAGVKNALSRLPQTKGLTNEAEAKATLEKAMKAVNPDYDPAADAKIDPAVVASVFTLPAAEVDDSAWNPAAALAIAASASDPAAFYRAICAGRRHGDPATADAWALPYRYTPNSPPNAAGVCAALAELPGLGDRLANYGEARASLEKAFKAINPGTVPDDEIDPELLAAAFAVALG